MNCFSFLALSWFGEKISGLGIWVARQIYSLIGVLYNVFGNIAKVNLFDRETFETLTENIYVMLGVAMLFIFAYNIILMIINPDNKKSTGSTTKMIQQTIISLSLVILLPSIFSWLYSFQNDVLDSQIITKIILNNVGSSDMPKESSDCKYDAYDELNNYTDYEGTKFNLSGGKKGKTTSDDARTILQNACNDVVTDANSNPPKINESVYGAYTIAPIVLSAFYYPTNFSYDECVNYIEKGASFSTDQEDISICINYYTDIELSKLTGNIKPFSNDKYLISIVSDDSKDSMELNWLMAWIAGGIALLMFFAYTIEVGVRVAKLGVLQLIAPIPMLLKIVPNQNSMYEKWFKMLRETYLDVFVRIVIINFSLFGISRVPSIVDQLFSNGNVLNGNIFVKSLTIVFLILGLLQFGRECPNLLKDFFGGSGKFSVKGGLKKFTDNPGVNALRSGVYGATTGKGWGRIGGLLSGTARGAVGGYDKAVKGIDTARTERDNESKWYNRSLDRVRIATGMETRAEKDDRLINRINDKLKVNTDDEKKLKGIKDSVTSAITKDTSKVRFTGFTFKNDNAEIIDFSNKKFTQVKEYEDVLKSAYEQATGANKTKAYEELVRFQNEFGAAMKKKTDEGLDALLKQQKWEFTGDDGKMASVFDDTDYASVQTSVSEVLFNEHDNITKINDHDDLKKALETIGSDSKVKSEQLSNATNKKGYQARHADSRVVRGQGQSEKK